MSVRRAAYAGELVFTASAALIKTAIKKVLAEWGGKGREHGMSLFDD